ncbi:hypothetical protein [Rickettsia amblyommatis]|uniref:Dihydrolipoamide dehydrogenase n=1 Tax=Rickettsia amblyommatis (strain GAT-30V) TaxID=1105111 RepID=H8K615_RICAG|nr:hypothetical protein [Rickettsia amblyommatis]AFC69959.1 dihydrolipoamide dehydrogenase [Rickettsia amblyommatis str. GAT-30V]KJV91223.1 putative dihydrolipoamide dehydrogenase [Rickettsia amblyommatis str. Darkwater]
MLVELPKLVQKFDLSEIITKVDYPGKHVSIFNAVGELASYAQLAKWAENAILKMSSKVKMKKLIINGKL